MMTKNSSVSPDEQQQQQSDIYQPSTYFYDLKLAELLRHNQHLKSPACLSMSTDYGFGSSGPSSSSSYASTSTLPMREGKGHSSIWCVEETDDSSMKKNYFVSSLECVV